MSCSSSSKADTGIISHDLRQIIKSHRSLRTLVHKSVCTTTQTALLWLECS